MGDTGSPYNLRYPELADAPNVPTDMQELASDVHAELATIDATIVALAPVTQRIATSVMTTNSANYDDSPEVSIATVAGSLITGKTYRIRYHFDLLGGVSGDQHFIRIHLDTVAGTTLCTRRYRAHTTDNYPVSDEVEYTAVATGSKTFVVGGVRESGTGNGLRWSTSTAPGFMYIDYIRG